ncbi:MAG: hypothetical protein A2144_01260 [Chloroflexi bacterium RBG_16_50_9]|nr:MAG: hypothetical protein A2144_01260 [Chloroflexi bacterium RBG_16_50_9]
MKLKRWLKLRHDGPSLASQLRLQFTGEPPGNPSECLIKEIVRESGSVNLDWLEEQVSDTLYRAELRRGGWALDIGIWGPAVFAKEAARILAEVRPQFAYLVREGETVVQSDSECQRSARHTYGDLKNKTSGK